MESVQDPGTDSQGRFSAHLYPHRPYQFPLLTSLSILNCWRAVRALECAGMGGSGSGGRGATTGAPRLHPDAWPFLSDCGPCLVGFWLLSSILSPPSPTHSPPTPQAWVLWTCTNFTSISQKTFPWRASGSERVPEVRVPEAFNSPEENTKCTCIPQPLSSAIGQTSSK